MKAYPLFATIVLFSILPVSAQTPDSCDTTGRYCFANYLYDCVEGKPVLVEECGYTCENNECVSESLAPDVGYGGPQTKKLPPIGSDWIVPISVILIITAILLLALNQVRLGRKYPKQKKRRFGL